MVGLIVVFLGKSGWGKYEYDETEHTKEVNVYRIRWKDNRSYGAERRDDKKN